MTAPRHTVLDNVAWGARRGLFYATVLSAWVVVVYFASGPGPFTKLNTTLAGTVALYFGGGLAGGLIVGILRPFIRNEIAAAVVGVVAAFPVCVGIKYIVEPGPWGPVGIIIVTCMPLFYGTILGPVTYRQGQRRRALLERKQAIHPERGPET